MLTVPTAISYLKAEVRHGENLQLYLHVLVKGLTWKKSSAH